MTYIWICHATHAVEYCLVRRKCYVETQIVKNRVRNVMKLYKKMFYVEGVDWLLWISLYYKVYLANHISILELYIVPNNVYIHE